MSTATPLSASVGPTVDFISRIRERVATVVVGQDVVVERMLIALFTGGHLLLQGVPGLAKTLLVSVLSKTIDLDFARIQFTIDLLPSGYPGFGSTRPKDARIQDPHWPRLYKSAPGGRNQSSGSKSASEHCWKRCRSAQVTIGGENFKLPAPFLVIATQNPVEQAGTFELPEAQLDRFMLCHRLEYPTPDDEREVLRRNMALGIAREGKGAICPIGI